VSTRPICVAVIGCGEIAQVMHLPNIEASADLELRAVCDISRINLDHVSERYRPPLATTEHLEVLADPSVDAVIIATYEHGAIALDALRAGKHVIVEKPLAFSVAEAEAIAAAAEEAGVVALVGYMKLYDLAFERFLAEIAGVTRLRSARVHDLAGRFDRHHGLFDTSRATDLDPSVMRETSARIEAQIRAELSPAAAERHGLVHNLLMLGSHDLAVLRAAFGPVVSVEWAHGEGVDNVRAVVTTASDAVVELTVGIGADYGWWDEWASVGGDHEAVRIDFPNPYLPHEPGTVTLLRRDERTVVTAGYRSAFRRELDHFVACISGEEEPRTPIRDAVSDVRAAFSIVEASAR
jgi:predicted dehydrogenase